jgi:hypothetical protein
MAILYVKRARVLFYRVVLNEDAHCTFVLRDTMRLVVCCCNRELFHHPGFTIHGKKKALRRAKCFIKCHLAGKGKPILIGEEVTGFCCGFY